MENHHLPALKMAKPMFKVTTNHLKWVTIFSDPWTWKKNEKPSAKPTFLAICWSSGGKGLRGGPNPFLARPEGLLGKNGRIQHLMMFDDV